LSIAILDMDYLTTKNTGPTETLKTEMQSAKLRNPPAADAAFTTAYHFCGVDNLKPTSQQKIRPILQAEQFPCQSGENWENFLYFEKYLSNAQGGKR
jgi:hypothetical protein